MYNTSINRNGKILLYSVDDFYSRIVFGSDCFICGAANDGKKLFNNEHILPQWLLSKCNLYSKTITLPNSANFTYGRYVIPCCEECNTELGNQLEIPISKLFEYNYADLCNSLRNNYSNLQLVFRWLALIFFKIHLKDTNFDWNLDSRRGIGRIGDNYDWSDMHHIHCIVRSHHTNAILSPKILGSIIITPAIQHHNIGPFDLAVNELSKTILLRINEICLICVLDDSQSCLNLFSDYLKKIKGPMTPFQLRELFTHMVYLNLNLNKRPKYYSYFKWDGSYYINAKLPRTIELIEEIKEISHGELLYYYCKDLFENLENKEAILSEIKQERRRFLFDEKGRFINVLSMKI